MVCLALALALAQGLVQVRELQQVVLRPHQFLQQPVLVLALSPVQLV